MIDRSFDKQKFTIKYDEKIMNNTSNKKHHIRQLNCSSLQTSNNLQSQHATLDLYDYGNQLTSESKTHNVS